MTAPQYTPELSREQIEQLRYKLILPYPGLGMPVRCDVVDRLCDLALRTLKTEAERDAERRS